MIYLKSSGNTCQHLHQCWNVALLILICSSSIIHNRGGGISGTMNPNGPSVPAREPSPQRASSPPKKKAPASSSTSGGGNIFDRLTDTSKYTGAHKARFGNDG